MEYLFQESGLHLVRAFPSLENSLMSMKRDGRRRVMVGSEDMDQGSFHIRCSLSSRRRTSRSAGNVSCRNVRQAPRIAVQSLINLIMDPKHF